MDIKNYNYHDWKHVYFYIISILLQEDMQTYIIKPLFFKLQSSSDSLFYIVYSWFS